MLTRLPIEIISIVIKQLPGKDVKSLSLVSKAIHDRVELSIWESVRIRPETEARLSLIRGADCPQRALRAAKHLRFHLEISKVTCERCPHYLDNGDPHVPDDEEEYALERPDEEFPRFLRLAREVEALVRRLEDDQLLSFSWDIGTCVPAEILGTHGIVSRKQSAIRSLTLVTDYTCEVDLPGSVVDLSSFNQLTSLCWKAPNVAHIPTLSSAIRSNAPRLQSLELDFARIELLDELPLETVAGRRVQKLNGTLPEEENNSEEEEEEEEEEEQDIVFQWERASYLATILGPNPSRGSCLSALPALQELTLSFVPVSAATARVVDVGVLRSMTLRKCNGWGEFLDEVVLLGTRIRLRSLEIDALEMRASHADEGHHALAGFLGSFRGLERLFMCLCPPVPEHEDGVWRLLWGSLSGHRDTLKSLVEHRRRASNQRVGAKSHPHIPRSFFFWPWRDGHEMGMTRSSAREMRRDPAALNPLAGLALESIGTTCEPARLSEPSLKLVHIRQSRFLAYRPGSSLADSQYVWLARSASHYGSGCPSSGDEDDDEDDDDDKDDVPDTSEEQPSRPAVSVSQGTGAHHLRPRFRRLAEWAFGPGGPPSLRAIAYGDFTHGGRDGEGNIIVVRSAGSGAGFRECCKDSRQWDDLVNEYRDMLEACPTQSLLD
ncbi:Putative F-box domain-containing protein [Colletotrichum destructivum]|uniref:F-box domain-containing protein n=1 Tax=Colletotrichum destructivum TaxID=34406 RepID=A0AAX4IN10_9PEZI|nr:Putative F-box domain-containing protein [Colletotrichum destructivum]